MNKRDVELLHTELHRMRMAADVSIGILGPLLPQPGPPDSVGQILNELDTAVRNFEDGGVPLAAAQVRLAVGMLRRLEHDPGESSVRQLEGAVVSAAIAVRDSQFSPGFQLLDNLHRAVDALRSRHGIGVPTSGAEKLAANLQTDQVVAKDTGPRIRPGDVVKLRSGGPMMTVEPSDGADGKIHVVWFSLSCSIDADLHRDKFPAELLVLVAAAGTEPPKERP